MGQFLLQSPLIPQPLDHVQLGWRPLIAHHPILEGNPSLTPGSDTRRAVTVLNQCGKTDLVAEYNDYKPLIAIRYDQSALVTSLGF